MPPSLWRGSRSCGVARCNVVDMEVSNVHCGGYGGLNVACWWNSQKVMQMVDGDGCLWMSKWNAVEECMVMAVRGSCSGRMQRVWMWKNTNTNLHKEEAQENRWMLIQHTQELIHNSWSIQTWKLETCKRQRWKRNGDRAHAHCK